MKLLFNTKIQLIILLIIFVVSFLIISTSNSVEQIPEEEPSAINTLKKAITLSKSDISSGIKLLEALENLPDYTNYKRKYILAKLYERKNDLNKTLSTYEEISSKNYPLKERVIFHSARINVQLGNDTKALKLINKLLHDFPNSKSIPQAKYLLAQTQLRLRLTPQAINTLNSLRSEFPRTQFGIATNYYLGEHSYNNNNYGDAIKYWRKYLEKSPDGRFANEISDFLESNKSFNLTNSDFTLLGNVFFHNKDYKKAATYYTIANNKKDFYNLGYSLYRLNRKHEAIKYLTEYAKEFPEESNSRFSLYYGAVCTPAYLRKPYWERMTKEIPSLTYYTEYKKAASESNPWHREKHLQDFIKSYPESLFVGDAVWAIMWLNIKRRDFNEAEINGESYISNHKTPPQDNPETWVKITFWLGNILEMKNNKEKAKEYFALAKDTLQDNYYSFRAQQKYSHLSGSHDNYWRLQGKTSNYDNLFWSIPGIISNKVLKSHFGNTVHELINLQEYEEAIDLIGKTQAPSKQVTAYLKALNKELDDSINTAVTITTKNKIPITNPIWELAYPLHFWHFIYESAKNYPGIDPLLVCSVIRQESRFDQNALSVSDAYGLMQIIPPTARSLARQLNITLHGNNSLYDPKLNISLGTKYLDGLISDFNNPLFAVASYNAGPQAVKRWLNTFNREWADRPNDLDIFIEEIPYDQTRDYVIKVFSNYWTYLRLYKQ